MASGSAGQHPLGLMSWENKPKAKIVVAVVGVVPVTVRGPTVPGIVDPGTATYHPVRAFRTPPQIVLLSVYETLRHQQTG